MTRRSFFVFSLVVALVVGGSFVLYTRFVPPKTVLSLVVFFLLLTIALVSLMVPLAYAVGHWVFASRNYRTTLYHAVRQGTIIALIIVLNLLLRALDSWNIFIAVMIIGAAVMIEVLSLARK